MKIHIGQHIAVRIIVWYSAIMLSILFIGGILSSPTLPILLSNLLLVPILFLLWTIVIKGRKQQ